MTIKAINEAIAEAERFLITAKAVRYSWDEKDLYGAPQQLNAACKRASMDLTRALARMRKVQ